MIRYISFDMDGTLVSEEFDNKIWNEELPRKYAEKKGISFEEAKDFCLKRYKEHQGHRSWTSLDFWFKMFGLTDWEDMLIDNANLIEIYPETKGVLKRLSKEYKLIVFTQAPKEFFDMKLVGLRDHFEKVYSSTHHFSSLRKDEETYRSILQDLDISPAEIIHIGDHLDYDYNVPRSLGIRSILLDREGRYDKVTVEDCVSSLEEFEKMIIKGAIKNKDKNKI